MTPDQMIEIGRALEQAGEQMAQNGHMLIVQGRELQRRSMTTEQWRPLNGVAMRAPIPDGPEISE